MTDTISTAYRAVLDYAERGWAAIPLRWARADGTCSCGGACDQRSIGKHPIHRGWTTGERLSGADIYAIWGEEYPHANVGIRTGIISGFWVLDVDPKNGGFESLAKLVADIGPLPTTYVVRTPSGGYHYYFAMPDFTIRNSANRELRRRYGPGLDIRGDGGQVVAPPSTTPYGAYLIQVDSPIVAAPDALLELMRAVGDVAGPDAEPIEDLPAAADLDPATAGRAQVYAQRTIEIVAAEYRDAVPGDGNDTLFRSACSAIEIAQSPWNTITLAAAYTALHDACLARRAVHPTGGGQGDNEFEQVWRSARNRTVGQGRALPPAGPDLTFDPFAGAVAAIDDPFSPLVMDAVDDDGDASEETGATATPTTTPAPAPVSVTAPTPPPAPRPVLDLEPPPRPDILATLPAEFYARRPWLTKLRTVAHNRIVAPDAVLGSYLAIVASQMPAGLHLHTTIGAPVTASLYSIMVGPSGAGKSAGTAVALTLYAQPVKTLGLGTGAGLIESFYGDIKVQDPETMRFTTERGRVTANQLFTLDEGAALGQMAAKQGSDTNSVLRSAWTGADPGNTNASKDRKRQLDARTYNLGLIMGMQPGPAADLLADTETGMAQRFLWFSVIDPAMPYSDGSDQPFPDVLTHYVHPDYVPLPAPTFIGGSPVLNTTPMVMTLPPHLRGPVREDRIRITRGEAQTEEHDSQKVATLLKLAMIFTYLDGLNEVSDDAWDMACQVYETSAAVRDQLLDLAQRRQRDEKLTAAHDKAREKQAINRYGGDQVTAIRQILGWIEAGRDTRRQITQSAKGARRELLADVLTQLVEQGHLKEVSVGNRQVKYERLTDWMP